MSDKRCDKCNDTFANKYSMERHKKDCTAIYCFHCEKKFNHKSTYSLHIKNNYQKIIKYYRSNRIDTTNIREIMEDKRKLEVKNKKLESENKELKKEYKKLLNNYQKIADANASALKYITQNFKSAPPLKPVEDYSVIQNGLSDEGFVVSIISRYRKKQFITYIREMLIQLYKTENPKKQSLWSTDISRLNYCVKQDEWIVDKKGLFIIDCVIVPLLKKLKKKALAHHKHLMSIEKEHKKIYQEYKDELEDLTAARRRRSEPLRDDLENNLRRKEILQSSLDEVSLKLSEIGADSQTILKIRDELEDEEIYKKIIIQIAPYLTLIRE